MKFAICNELFAGWSLQQTFDYLARAGYDGVELAPFTLGDSVLQITTAERKGIRRLAQDAGLTITGLHWLLAKPEGLHLTHPDAAVRQRTQEYLQELIRFCGEIGGTVMVFGSPAQRTILPGVTPAAGWQYAVEGFQLCGDTAREWGVTLCLEALPANQTNLLNTNAQVRAMLEEINHPQIQMMLDVKSMCAEELPIPTNIRECHGLFHHVHANDANLKGPGFGETDYRPIFAALTELKYAGFISVEVFDYSPDPETIARESLRYMKSSL